MTVSTLGVIGAGRLGTAVARLAVRTGLDVCVAGSRAPEFLRDRVAREVPGARPGTVSDAAACDVVVLALPLRRLRELDATAFEGRIVVDATNLVPLWDAPVPEAARAPSSSQYVQGLLAGAHVVKTLNHLGADELEDDAAAPGSPGRRALGVAGDDPDAVGAVMALVERLGFDAVAAGPLAAGVALEPGTEVFEGLHDREDLRELFSRTARPTPSTPLN